MSRASHYNRAVNRVTSLPQPFTVESYAFSTSAAVDIVIYRQLIIFIIPSNSLHSFDSGPVLEVSQRPGWLHSASFSPTDANRIAVAGDDGAELLDMRNPLQ